MIEHDRFSVWHSFVKSGGGRSTSRSDAPPVNTRLLNVDRQATGGIDKARPELKKDKDTQGRKKMRTTWSDVFCYLIVAILAVMPTLPRADDKTQSALCDASEIGRASCGRNQRCRMINEGASICECLRDFHFVDNECVRVAPTTATIDAINLKPDLISESGGSSIAAGLLIPIFLIAVGVLLYFSARRYKWLQRFRQYRHNRYGNVLVTRDDDDDDDPPIA
ncbi:hypothetical protein HN011_000997 [Eciton burchellii]|nr:hypothetical protein HN011_000997 [Eciton burchellii]